MKYVIEIDDEVEVIVTIRYTRGFNGGGTVLADTQYVEGLEPLTADYINEHFPDLIDNAKEERDRIVKESIGKAYQQGLVDGFNGEYDESKAYQRGLEDGKKQAKAQAELDVCHDVEKMAKDNYNKGLEDAWGMAKKICGEERGVGIPMEEIEKIFHVGCADTVIEKYSYHEVAEKLRAYEQKQKEDAEIIQPVADLNESILKLANEAGQKLGELYSALKKMKGE